jgi:hypothetical protein
MPSAQFYQKKGCTIVVGDLHITNLPSPIIRAQLLKYLGSIKHITGTLFFVDNAYLVSLSFLSNVVSLGGIVLRNNPSLLDSRLVSLVNRNISTTITGCDRLCPARYPSMPQNSDDSACTNVVMKLYLIVNGPALPSYIGLTASVFTRMVSHASQNQVFIHIYTLIRSILCNLYGMLRRGFLFKCYYYTFASDFLSKLPI